MRAGGIKAGPGMTSTPLAYAHIRYDASRAGGSANLSCVWDTTYIQYNCAIPGETFVESSHVVHVTTMSGAWIPGAEFHAGQLQVSFTTTSGAAGRPGSGFSITVCKP